MEAKNSERKTEEKNDENIVSDKSIQNSEKECVNFSFGKFSKNQENESKSTSTIYDSQVSNQPKKNIFPLNSSVRLPDKKFDIPSKAFKSYNETMVQKVHNNLSISINSLFPNGLNKKIIFDSFPDQQKTIILQRAIRSANTQMIENIILELKGTFRKIIKDKNGNYFASDLFKVCQQNELIIVLTELSPTISEDCSNNFSTHPIQTLIDRATSEKEYSLILYSFNDYNKFLFSALDPNGAYTIQKIIERIPERYRTNFNIIFTSFIGFISKKKFGIVVVKKFISCTKSDDVTTLLLNLIRKDFINYAVDQYANYLIQFLLEKWKDTPEGKELKEMVRDNFFALCEKKYSSFICEMYIKIISPDEKKELIDSISINDINNRINNPHFIKIMKILGIYNNQNNNFQLPQNLNNNFIPNNNNFGQNMFSRFNFVNNNIYHNNNNNNNNNNIYNNFNDNNGEFNKYMDKKNK